MFYNVVMWFYNNGIENLFMLGLKLWPVASQTQRRWSHVQPVHLQPNIWPWSTASSRTSHRQWENHMLFLFSSVVVSVTVIHEHSSTQLCLQVSDCSCVKRLDSCCCLWSLWTVPGQLVSNIYSHCRLKYKTTSPALFQLLVWSKLHKDHC